MDVETGAQPVFHLQYIEDGKQQSGHLHRRSNTTFTHSDNVAQILGWIFSLREHLADYLGFNV